MLVPYFLWTGFAGALTLSVWQANPRFSADGRPAFGQPGPAE
jgi:hypothetical protein